MHDPNFDQTRPIYLQLMEDIMSRAVRGELKPGDKIPSARDFAQEKLVNPNTVVRAYQELERIGFIQTRRGLGSFITEDYSRIQEAREDLASQAIERLLQELRKLGMDNEAIEHLVHKKLETSA
ncbi:GntR family transcriptional regulator [Deinococcus cellulosilyticus]|uniref:GntR family transcriptional regulator n=1 Tax=Deinococcus cellulosilyticus (strain DSM 18568 / NBRC 106333 / KACC 11606 / 5516J-15) TaxID=1223518 RepID=A0A511N4D2_DEIC1|nr:GntR family transcriptional regulator [Deinococcus cellulosilyticus]GEM47685.1 GntR family transcriptional regulator [Deinococcus cellulosilyticus NBRC 106333 = KACC 11606]